MVPFVLTYMTCDDFQKQACLTCLQQDYNPKWFRVLICDDSAEEASRRAVGQFAAEHGIEHQVITRTGRKGFKAGNFNHAVFSSTSPEDEWIVVVDADQTLPKSYLSDMAAAILRQPPEIAFIQAAHRSDDVAPASDSTPFQAALGDEIDIFYQRSMPPRGRFGFLPFIGHGAALRRESLVRFGGLPEMVSEDFAFSLRLRAAGVGGSYAESIVSLESFPKDFGALVTRLGKFAGGSAELLRRATGAFFRSDNVPWCEKIDFLMLLLWYPLSPLVFLNSYLSAYVCHRLWTASHRIPFLHPVLPYVFLLMFILSIPIMLSASRRAFTVLRYWFWSTAVYAATVPIAACQFLMHIWRAPGFTPTPKGLTRAKSLFWHGLLIVPLGLATLHLSTLWHSPFSPILASHGAAFVCFPAYLYLAERSIAGMLARVVIWFPGALFLAGLYAMWTRGSF